MRFSCKWIGLVAISLLVAACSPKLTSNMRLTQEALGSADDVLVVFAPTAIPEDALLLGNVKVGDTGFTTPANGSTDAVMALVREEARKNGGNVVKVVKSIPPSFNCTTHQIEAEIYYLNDLSLLTGEEEIPLLVNPEHPDYAIVYVYRTDSSMGSMITYDVYANDTKVYRCSKNTKAEVRIYEPGKVTFWAKTEARSEAPLEIKLGEEYYIECGVSMGAFVGRPQLKVMDPRYGSTTYKSIITK